MRLGTYFRKELLDKLNIKTFPEDIVLDVGCFDGYWLSTQKAKEKYGLDLDIVKKYKDVNYVYGSGLDIPFKNNKFNKVFAFDVIEHLPKNTEVKFLSELIRTTKFSGEIILTFPSDSIRIWPNFMTNFISKRWGHYKYLGLSKHQIGKFLNNFKKIKYEIRDLNTRKYLDYYLILRFLWILDYKITKSIIRKLVKNEVKNLKGCYGYYLLIITKDEDSV